MLEFVEHFLMKDPLTDFRTPIDMENWFDASKVQAKRAEIAAVLRIKTEEADRGASRPMPQLKFFDDSIVVDSENNNDANVIDKMEEEKDDGFPGDFPDNDAAPVVQNGENNKILKETVGNPSDEDVELPSQAEIIGNYKQQLDANCDYQPEEFMLSSQDVFDEQNYKCNSTTSSNEADPLMDADADEKMQLDDETIVLSD